MSTDMNVSSKLPSWTGRARHYLDALREPVHKLLERKKRLENAFADRVIFNAYVKSDHEWKKFSQTYYSGVAMSGDAIAKSAILTGSATGSGLGGLFIVIGGGINVMNSLTSLASKLVASGLLDKRMTTETRITDRMGRKLNHPSSMDDPNVAISPFQGTLYAAEKKLRVIQTSRKLKKMSDFYQQMDAASDETVLKFVASEEILHGYYRVIFSNLWRHATEGLEHLKQASSWLDEMNASPIRDAKVQEFLTIANAFKPETRMLPHILNNAANNHSVWSEIQDLCKHAESLKTSNAKPHLVVENPDPSPTSPPTSPQLRQVRRRP